MTPVAICLVLLLDQSHEVELQARATARALLHPNIVRMAESQPVAVSVMTWAGDVATTWTLVESAASAYRAGGSLYARIPARREPTPLSGALAHAAGLFTAAPAAGYECRSRVVDVSGLDPGLGEPLYAALGLLHAQRAEVNAIVFGNKEQWRASMPGFVVPVTTDVYRQALIGKLARELAADTELPVIEYRAEYPLGGWREYWLVDDLGSDTSEEVVTPGLLGLLMIALVVLGWVRKNKVC